MQISWQKIASVTLMIAVLAFCGIGCSKKNETNNEGLKVISNTHYTAPAKADVPNRYENVTGAALFSISGELKEQLALLNEKTPLGSDQFFVLLNPKVPTEGILVKSPTPIDTNITSMSNHQIAVTGNVVIIDVPDCPLVDCFLEKYGFSLAGDSKNRAVYIDAEYIDDPESLPRGTVSTSVTTTATPEAGPSSSTSATPGVTEPPAAELTHPAEEAPASNNTPETASSQPASDAPAAIPASEKSHSLQVTPAPQMSQPTHHQPVPSAQVKAPAVAEQAAATEKIAPAEAANDTPQDVAPTAQPLSSLPLPQDVVPTPQTLEQ